MMNPQRKKISRARKCLIALALVMVVVTVSGCQTLSFYKQAIKGQYQLMAHRQAIEKVISNPKTGARLTE